MSGNGREIVTIHIGQAGLQIGAAMWELYCREHNLDNQGYGIPGTDRAFEKVENLFYETKEQKYVPRCVQVDLEPTVMDEIRCGIYRDLYTPSALINSCPDAANNFARGALTNGETILEPVMQSIRKLCNLCDNVSSFKIVHSFTGGTGSGLTSRIVEKLTEIYGKKFKFGVGVYPSTKFSQAMVDPYNTMLLTSSTIDEMDCVCVFDNESLYNIMTKMLGVEGPHFIHINRMMAQMVSSITLAHRFRYNDSKHSDLDELLTNLVPYPRIHFPLVSYAPLINWDEQAHSGFSVGELTDACFLPENQTLNVDVTSQKYFSCAMLYRGLMSSKEIYDSLNRVKGYKNIQFVDWCPTGFKVALNMCKPYVNSSSELASGDRAVCMIAGNGCISQAWMRVKDKFDLLYSRRAFVHWYVGEGMEESEFDIAKTMIQDLKEDYWEIAKELGDVDPNARVLNFQSATANNKNKRADVSNSNIQNINFNNAHIQKAGRSFNNRIAFSVNPIATHPITKLNDFEAKYTNSNRSAASHSSIRAIRKDRNDDDNSNESNFNQAVLFGEAMQLLSNINLKGLICKGEYQNQEGVADLTAGSKSSLTVSKELVTPLESNNTYSSMFEIPPKADKGVGTDISDTSVTTNSYGSDYALVENIAKNNNSSAPNQAPSPAPRGCHQLHLQKEKIPIPSPRFSRLRLLSSTGDISSACQSPPSISKPLQTLPLSDPQDSVESLFETNIAPLKATRKTHVIAEEMPGVQLTSKDLQIDKQRHDMLDQQHKLQILHQQFQRNPTWLQQHHLLLQRKLQEQQLELQKLQRLQLEHSKRTQQSANNSYSMRKDRVTRT